MDISGLYLAEFVTRWLHVLAGIVWIGHLYFFNFVNGNFQKTLDAETKKKVVLELMPRALFFFRWGAMITFLLGLVLLYFVYLQPGHTRSLMSPPGFWIMIGIGFGTIMWFNVWFIIWPSQKKIINGLKTANPAPPNVVSLAANASKLNTYLSFPLIFCMLAGPHFPFFSIYWAIGILAVAFGMAWAMYKIGVSVSTNV
jgi:uncharacterized membrane protein